MLSKNVPKVLAAGFTLVRRRKVKKDLSNIHYVVERYEPGNGWVQIYSHRQAYFVKEMMDNLLQDQKVLEINIGASLN